MPCETDAVEMDRWLQQLDTTVNEVFEGMLGMPASLPPLTLELTSA
jgi:hypothetical protein